MGGGKGEAPQRRPPSPCRLPGVVDAVTANMKEIERFAAQKLLVQKMVSFNFVGMCHFQ